MVLLWSLWNYITYDIGSLPDWEHRYIHGNTEAPTQWRLGEWGHYKVKYPQKARTHIHDSWTKAKAEHDNNLVRRLFKQLGVRRRVSISEIPSSNVKSMPSEEALRIMQRVAPDQYELLMKEYNSH